MFPSCVHLTMLDSKQFTRIKFCKKIWKTWLEIISGCREHLQTKLWVQHEFLIDSIEEAASTSFWFHRSEDESNMSFFIDCVGLKTQFGFFFDSIILKTDLTRAFNSFHCSEKKPSTGFFIDYTVLKTARAFTDSIVLKRDPAKVLINSIVQKSDMYQSKVSRVLNIKYKPWIRSWSVRLSMKLQKTDYSWNGRSCYNFLKMAVFWEVAGCILVGLPTF